MGLASLQRIIPCARLPLNVRIDASQFDETV